MKDPDEVGRRACRATKLKLANHATRATNSATRLGDELAERRNSNSPTTILGDEARRWRLGDELVQLRNSNSPTRYSATSSATRLVDELVQLRNPSSQTTIPGEEIGDKAGRRARRATKSELAHHETSLEPDSQAVQEIS